MAEPAPQFAIVDNPEKHRFELDLGDGSLAIAEYNLLEGKIVFTHTEVPPGHEGRGIGSALIRHALGVARARKLQVIPICPFFAAYMKRHEEVQDLLDPSYRSALGLTPLTESQSRDHPG
jgi:predicted GNAT family acetyltransferase